MAGKTGVLGVAVEHPSRYPELPPDDLKQAKAHEIVHNFALSYTASFNTLFIAIVFGIFSILMILNVEERFSVPWFIMSAAYLLFGLSGGYFFVRAMIYAKMAEITARRMGIIGMLEGAYDEAVHDPNSLWIIRVLKNLFHMGGLFEFFNEAVLISFGITVLFLWIAVALL